MPGLRTSFVASETGMARRRFSSPGRRTPEGRPRTGTEIRVRGVRVRVDILVWGLV